MKPLRLIVSGPAFIIIFIASIHFLIAGSSPNVPIENRVYRDIDQLVAAGLIQDAIYGQRPWSRREIARMVHEARQHLPELGSIVAYNPNLGLNIMAEELIHNLEQEYQSELSDHARASVHFLTQASFDAAYLDSPFRAIPANNGLSSIKSSINPLIAYKEGCRYADGGTFAAESEHWAQTSKYFSIYGRPRVEVRDPRTNSADVSLRAQTLYGKFTVKNLEMEIGRDSLIWGQGEYGGVLASNNARNLDIAKLSNDSPFVHPWVFRYLGPSKYTFFVGRLGSDYTLRNAYLYGLAISFKPIPSLEIGLKHQTTVGGEGSPRVDFGQIVREFFFLRASGWPQESMDNREGMDVRFQIRQLRNAVVYAEGVFEDFGRKSFWPQLTEQMGFTSGLYFPRLTNDGANDLRIEFERSPAAYGRHYLYSSGLTVDNRLRGSELGPDGTAVHTIWRHFFPFGTQFRGEAHYERRRTDSYIQTPTPDGGVDRVVRITDYPIEHRFRIQSSLDRKLNDQWTFRPAIGYERVWNYASDPLARRNNLLGMISIIWSPRNLNR